MAGAEGVGRQWIRPPGLMLSVPGSHLGGLVSANLEGFAARG